MAQQHPIVQVSAEVVSREFITPTVFELKFNIDRPAPFLAGQFLSIVIPAEHAGGKMIRRAYSIASAPQMCPLELCVTLVKNGPGSGYLHALNPGDKFTCFIPYGNFFYHPTADRGVCFIATGTGVAPFRSIVLSEQYRNNPPPRSLCLFGVRETEEILYDRDFSRSPGLQWIVALSRPNANWQGFRGRVTDYLRSIAATFEWQLWNYYLCGSGAMITEVKQILQQHGVEKVHIFQEAYYKS